jgi:hypothetical protein
VSRGDGGEGAGGESDCSESGRHRRKEKGERRKGKGERGKEKKQGSGIREQD